MDLLVTFGTSLLTTIGALELAGMFFGLVCVIFLILWKLNSAAYDALLKFPARAGEFILMPIVWLCLFIGELIRHPVNILYLLRSACLIILIAPVVFIAAFLKELFITPFNKAR